MQKQGQIKRGLFFVALFIGEEKNKMNELKFKDEGHKKFYDEKTQVLGSNEYLKSLIYLVGLSSTTRGRWNEIFQEEEAVIKPEVLKESWQTGTSLRILRLGFQLYTDSTVSDIDFETGEQDIEECRKYSVSDIFCCEYAPFFVEAVKLRYPVYFRY